MAKLAKGSYPENSNPNDFECFGPPATKDGEFDNVMIVDMGCFTQDGKDSNKFYHAAVVQHKTTKKWYTYFEWGRVGQTPTCQFTEYSSQSEAQKEFAKQCHTKNDKRGQWTTIAGIKTLTAKPGKDCYLVRPLATRSTGLPDAAKIKINDGVTATKVIKEEEETKKKVNIKKIIKKIEIDSFSLKLLRDLNVGTIAYTKGSMADQSIPTQGSIDDARQLLQEAKQQVAKIGDNVENQVANSDLQLLTKTLYSRIPKIKARNAAPETWILSQSNILMWESDLDAFESALGAVDDLEQHTEDPYGGLPIKLEYLDPVSRDGKFIRQWMPKATRNRHGGIGDIKIKNVWRVVRQGDQEKILRFQDTVLSQKVKIGERPILQPSQRPDVDDMNRYINTNTALLYHGSRSINVRGILDKGLMLPKKLIGVVLTGSAFGQALYHADDWKKSAGYTSMRGSYWSSGGGSISGRDAFIFINDVVLGNAHVAPRSYGYASPPSGFHSVFGKADVSGVMNNEWMVYESIQCSLRYLVEFSA